MPDNMMNGSMTNGSMLNDNMIITTTAPQTMPVASTVIPDSAMTNMILQVETEELKVKQVAGDGRNQKVIEAELEVPVEKPDIEKILQVDVKIKPSSKIRVIDDKVIIDGCLEIDTLYVGENTEGSQPVHHMHHLLKYGAYVDVPGAEKDMDADVDVEVESVYYDLIEPCRIRVSIVLKFDVKVTEVTEIKVVTDMKLISQSAAQTASGGSISIGGTAIPIEGGPTVTTVSTQQGTYTVVSGDTLGAIANRYGVTVDDIAKANNISDIHKLSIGQVLIIPGK